jgi:soluble lytic murein transglycosylase
LLNKPRPTFGPRTQSDRRARGAILAAGAALLAAAGLGPAAIAQPPKATGTVKKVATKVANSTAVANLTANSATGETATAHFAALDRAIAPLRAYGPSSADAALIRDAIQAVRKRKPDDANGLKARISDPVGRKLIDWYLLRSGFGESAQQYKAFLEANPAWPDRKLLYQRLETALFTDGGDAAAIKSYFLTNAPRTGAGMAALASAYLAEGNKAKAKSLAAKTWRESDLPDELEAPFLARFGSLLTAADHKWRLDRLLDEDIRWSSGRNARAKVVKRVIPLLSPAEQKKAHARLAVFLRSKGAQKLIDALPAETKPDWGLAFHRIQLLRRSGHEEEAAKLLLGAPTDANEVPSLDAWWEERRILAYDALNNGNPKLAYALVRDAGALSVNPLKEQQFMAGWLSLRFLKNVSAAERHFQAFRKAADGPLSRSKASYWLARTAEARGDKAKAREYYQEATRDIDTFHGLLSLAALNPGKATLKLTPPELPTKEQIDRFNSMDAVKAVVLARKAGLDRAITRPFLYQLRYALNSEAELALASHLGEAIGDTQTSLRVAKTAIARGNNLITYGYPVHSLPSYKALRPPPETAFLLGIARQETEFNSDTVSGAGARGILQVMPVTAKHVCRDYKIKCDMHRLLNDSSYNTMIASAYVGDRMAEFAGSYVLGIAGYNAGPGRARQWVRQFGDPRSPDVDPIDWIERIPFTETREYVAKVLSNIQVYRSRLAGGTSRLRIMDDLRRARVQAEKPARRGPAEADSRTSPLTDGG